MIKKSYRTSGIIKDQCPIHLYKIETLNFFVSLFTRPENLNLRPRFLTVENSNYLYSDLSSKVLKAFFNVYNTLGYGFLEKVYENSMIVELHRFDLKCSKQQQIEVYYKDEKVGYYFADIIVENRIIIELKAAEAISPEHEAQLVNYLKATEIEVGLLLNFGKTPQHVRRVLTKEYKKGGC